MVEFPQTIKHVAPPTMELKNLVLQGQVRHGGNPVLRWMAENVAVLVDVNGNERLTKKASTARIDGVAALVTALGRASVGETAPSVYEQRGVLDL
jgi:phage terminase large subunit-like protein